MPNVGKGKTVHHLEIRVIYAHIHLHSLLVPVCIGIAGTEEAIGSVATVG